MWLPWSALGNHSTTNDQHPSSKRGHQRTKKHRPAARRAYRPFVELLEDRTLPALIFVDVTNPAAGNGTQGNPYRSIQAALKEATANADADEVRVYGNNSTNPQHVYVWTQDSDRNDDGTADGNMVVPANDRLIFRAKTLPPSGDPNAGNPARVTVKLFNNIIDVAGELRAEGRSGFPVVFTSFFDDTVGGDTNQDGGNNPPGRRNWGGIRFRGGAVDQGPTAATGSLIDNGEIRFTGATLADAVSSDEVEFASIRMEWGGSNRALTGELFDEAKSARVRVSNTAFRNGGKAFDVDFFSLQGTGPEIRKITFNNNSINGLFVNIPFFPRVPNLNISSQWDDVGVPYVLTQRLLVTGTLTVNAGMAVKLHRTEIQAFGGTIQVRGVQEQPVLFTSLFDDNITHSAYANGSRDTNNDGNTFPPEPGQWGGISAAQGNIDHAIIRFGGGDVPVPSVIPFQKRSAVSISNVGGQTFRLSNTEITRTAGGLDQGNQPIGGIRMGWRVDSAAVASGVITVVDNHIHDNASMAVVAEPISDPNFLTPGFIFSDALVHHNQPHPYGGYGVHFRRNVLANNDVNGVYSVVIGSLGLSGYLDDTDIVQVITGSRHPDNFITPGIGALDYNQVIQLMSKRTVFPANGTLSKFQGAASAGNTARSAFLARLASQGAEQGPLPADGDNGIFHFFIDFEKSVRNPAAFPADQKLRGLEWRDWGVDFRTTAAPAPFIVTAKSTAINGDSFSTVSGSHILTTGNNSSNGSMELVFPNMVTALGFWVVDNETTSANERINFFGERNNLLETIPLPTTGSGPVFVGRISQQPIFRVVITEDASDTVSGSRDAMGIDDLYFVDAGQSLVIKAQPGAESSIVAGFHLHGSPELLESTFDGQPIGSTDFFGNPTELGGTIRILGQRNKGIVLTSLPDDGAGTGIVNHPLWNTNGGSDRLDTNNDGGGSAPAPGNWPGVKILPGANTSRVENVIQQSNGTIVRTSSDKNPYTIGDEPGSDTDTLSNGMEVNLQDGVLIEHADIRYAGIGIENRGFPDGKLSIEGNESENNDDAASAEAIIPLIFTPGLVGNNVAFQSYSGAYRVGGHLGNLNSVPSVPGGEKDVDYYLLPPLPELPPPPGPDFTRVFIDVEDARVPTNVAVFNANNQLVYFNSDDYPMSSRYASNPDPDVDIPDQPSDEFTNNTATPIPDDGTPIVSDLPVGPSFTVRDVDVRINITHPFVSDLRVELIGPGGGPIVKLVEGEGGDGDNFTDTIFDDEAGESIVGVPANRQPFTARFRPEEPLDVFDGQNSAGTWQLRVTDTKPGDTGTLNSWSITLARDSIPVFFPIFVPGTFDISDVDVRLNITHPFVSDLRIELFSPNLESVKLIEAEGGDGDNFTATILDDEAPESIVGVPAARAPFTARFRPEEPLSRFDGDNAGGVWFLRITDLKTEDTGTLNSWSLDFEIDGSGNTVGPVTLFRPDIEYVIDPMSPLCCRARDAHYIVLSGAGRVPDVLRPDPQDENAPIPSFYPILGGEGFEVRFFDENDTEIVIPGDIGYTRDDARNLNNSSFFGGYEMELRTFGFSSTLNAPRATEGEVIIRHNSIRNFQDAGISLQDDLVNVSGTRVPTQSARYGYLTANSSNFFNQHFMIPGTQIYSNLVIGGAGDGIRVTETQLAAGAGTIDNLPVPTAFHLIVNNTIHGNADAGIEISSRGGPNVLNNIVTNNGAGIAITDYGDIAPGDNTNFVTRGLARSVVAYNILFGNALTGEFNGTNNRTADPRYVDAANLDFRLLPASPGIDAALSDLPDRLGLARFPAEPTRAPEADFRRRARADGPPNNLGSGSFPFYDIGALELNEGSTRISSLSLFTPDGRVTRPVTEMIITFSGRVDPATVAANTVRLVRNTASGPVTVNFAAITNSYETGGNQHTFTFRFSTALVAGSYQLVLDGTSPSSSPLAIKDIFGLLLDGERLGDVFPTGNGAPGGDFVYDFTVV